MQDNLQIVIPPLNLSLADILPAEATPPGYDAGSPRPAPRTDNVGFPMGYTLEYDTTDLDYMTTVTLSDEEDEATPTPIRLARLHSLQMLAAHDDTNVIILDNTPTPESDT
jgi:hypothetical protein